MSSRRAESLRLPGLGVAPGPEAVARALGQLSKLVDPVLALATARATINEFAAPELGVLRAALGLDQRARPRLSPLAWRALALALEAGRVSAHQDLRSFLPPTPEPQPSEMPYKFRAFHQESPVALRPVRGPKLSRWDVHHLWHACHGMLWLPNLARGDLYAGLRLNEAASEAHWYCFDEVLGPRCEAHDDRGRGEIGPESWPDCARCDESEVRRGDEHSVALLRAGLRFWDGEAASTDLFRLTRVVTPNPLTGAIGNWREAFEFLVRHEGRLRSRPFQRWVEACLVPGIDYETSYRRFRDGIAHRLGRLLLGPIEVDLGRARIRQARVVLIDLAARVAQAEQLGQLEAGAFEIVATALECLRPLALPETPAAPEDGQRAAAIAWNALLEVADREGSAEALAQGIDLESVLGKAPSAEAPRSKLGVLLVRDGVQLAPLARALADLLPLTARAAAIDDPLLLARRVALTPEFRSGRKPLEVAARAALASDPAVLDLLRYERLLAGRDAVEVALREDLFALAPDRAEPGEGVLLKLNPSLAYTRFEHDVLALARGEQGSKRRLHIWSGAIAGRGFLIEAEDLVGVAGVLKRPVAWERLVGPGGVFAGRNERVLELVRLGLLVVVEPTTPG